MGKTKRVVGDLGPRPSAEEQAVSKIARRLRHEPELSLDEVALGVLQALPWWEACCVLCVRGNFSDLASKPSDEENAVMAFKFRTGYEPRSMVAELRSLADSLEEALKQ
jgi:hypothetical protein